MRIVQIDGEDFDLEMDLWPGRMNVAVEDGVVVDVHIEQDPGPPPVEPLREDATFAPDRIVLSADVDRPGEVIEVTWPEEDGRGWDDIGVDGPGPDLIEIPDIAGLGSCRVCATDVPVCAPLEIDIE